jgi:hypothetical protein
VIISRKVRLVGHLGYIREMRKSYKSILGGRYEGKRTYLICRHIWRIILKWDFKEIGCEVVD